MPPWDAARWRQRSYVTPPVRKLRGPVGPAALQADYRVANCQSDHVWKCCGHHLCSCVDDPPPDERGPLATHAPVYGYWPVEHVTREQVAYMYPVQRAIEHGQTADAPAVPVMLTQPYRIMKIEGVGREVPPEPMTPCPEAFETQYDCVAGRMEMLGELQRRGLVDRKAAIALLTTGAYPACNHCNQPDDMPHVEGCPMLIPPFKRPWGKYLADQENDSRAAAIELLTTGKIEGESFAGKAYPYPVMPEIENGQRSPESEIDCPRCTRIALRDIGKALTARLLANGWAAMPNHAAMILRCEYHLTQRYGEND